MATPLAFTDFVRTHPHLNLGRFEDAVNGCCARLLLFRVVDKNAPRDVHADLTNTNPNNLHACKVVTIDPYDLPSGDDDARQRLNMSFYDAVKSVDPHCTVPMRQPHQRIRSGVTDVAQAVGNINMTGRPSPSTPLVEQRKRHFQISPTCTTASGKRIKQGTADEEPTARVWSPILELNHNIGIHSTLLTFHELVSSDTVDADLRINFPKERITGTLINGAAWHYAERALKTDVINLSIHQPKWFYSKFSSEFARGKIILVELEGRLEGYEAGSVGREGMVGGDRAVGGEVIWLLMKQ
ncbi:hypothetical protein HK097_009315 [Rhizophlyctis rosea]|uniref:Uncharacterized protein n=1 Tax=Rhizophlyctis rosea TaxID=64517 RepID=A0AAD5SBW4_9FUNG|nr:hypothetical protein HK097_009315 [Rhizophlyctis rosea]